MGFFSAVKLWGAFSPQISLLSPYLVARWRSEMDGGRERERERFTAPHIDAVKAHHLPKRNKEEKKRKTRRE